MKNHQKLYLGLIVLMSWTLAAGCGSSPEEGAATPLSPKEAVVTTTPIHSTTSIPIPTPTPTRMAPAVDATTLSGKTIFGYQGWFSCPGDGSKLENWEHWFIHGAPPVVEALVVDFWPDTSELTPEEKCETDIILPDGTPLYAYSSYNPQTVARHFQWMEKYGIDGVEVQRFTVPEDYDNLVMRNFRDQVLMNARGGAEIHGRIFYIQFAAVQNGGVELIKQDWQYLVDELKILESPQYLHHNGLPVVSLWGIGFNFETNFLGPQEALDLIGFFKSHPDPRYRATVMGGVSEGWRTLTGASFTDPIWAEVYRSLDVISPWSAPSFHGEDGADDFLNEYILPDLAETKALGIDYMPTVWPGISVMNLKARRNQNSPYNFVPRDGGKFYWHQVYNAVSAGADMLYVAMFDEIDEGTSMYKMVETEKELPEGRILVPLNIDGYNLPSDWYLRLGAETGKMLRGEIPLSPEFPFQETLDELMIKGQFAGANAAGEWETTDAEGSLETMTIQQLSDNEFFVELFDNESKACGTGGNGDPIPVRAEGIGESRGNAIFITEFAITCLGDPEWLLATVSNTLTYNPATESLIDSWDSIWTRVK